MPGFEAEGFILNQFFLEACGIGQDIRPAEMVGMVVQRGGAEGGAGRNRGDSLATQKNILCCSLLVARFKELSDEGCGRRLS